MRLVSRTLTLTLVLVLLAGSAFALSAHAGPADGYPIEGTPFYLPLIAREQIPQVPALSSIDNSDQDNYFSVVWTAADSAEQYVLQESLDPSFTAPQTVYQGPDLVWSVPTPGKTPATILLSDSSGELLRAQRLDQHSVRDDPSYVRGSRFALGRCGLYQGRNIL